ncbi:GlxA family transcriptional regulator [Pelagibius sp. Alg239-R121]|uniref:GlxA family transcriptional regulator n=1 Tax=Pelagibius sp. Alg239-R121 TaxID=2993448 RepID=UPI0024A6BB63|nr:GlxA family transcriptional regulator [Pelagibius sp. Alg239-R121]
MATDMTSFAGREFSKIAFVLIPRFNMMTLMTTIEPMRIANYLSPQSLFEWTYLSFEGEEISANNGMRVRCETPHNDSKFDIVFVVGSWGCERYVSPSVINWIRRQERKGSVICAFELGVYVLAQAGLLSGRLATTHWSCMAGFAEQFPMIDLREQLFTIDRNLITCAGGTTGIDLMLHLIATCHNEQLASEVADQIMHHPVRKGDAVQRHTLGGTTDMIHPDVAAAVKIIEDNVSSPLSVPEVAQEIGLSQRQLERYFKRYMGCSVVQFSQLMRLQYARVLLTTTRLSIREVSVASGFNSMSHFSHAFLKCFGKKPSQYRQAWPDNETAPTWRGTVYSLVEASRLNAQRKAQVIK